MTTARDRIAITGVGMVTPLGDSVGQVVEAAEAGRTAVAPSEWVPEAGAATIADFDATRYVNVRGMRVYSRATRLGISSVKLALVDAKLEAGVPAERLGIVTGSTFGHFESLVAYDQSLWRVGPQETNPALMPLALPSSSGSGIALGFGAKAFSITLASQGSSSLDAVAVGARGLASGRADACVLVSSFALSEEIVRGAHAAGWLAPADAFRVFDARHAGTALAEAGVAVVLEREETARARGAVVLGWILGYASTFAAGEGGRTGALGRACRRALDMGGVAPSDLGVVSSGASGVPSVDRAEAAVALELFSSARAPLVTAPKANLGETLDPGGLLGAVLTLHAARSGRVIPVARLEQPAVAGPRYAAAGDRPATPFVLATTASLAGSCGAVLLSSASE